MGLLSKGDEMAKNTAPAKKNDSEVLCDIIVAVDEMGRDFGGVPAPLVEQIKRLRKLCGLVT